MAASRVCSFVEPVHPVTMAKRSACSLAPFAAGLMPWAGMPSSPQIEVISVHQASTCPTLRAIFALAAPLLPRVQVRDVLGVIYDEPDTSSASGDSSVR